MKRFLLAGGGTAGHVNPLLAFAEEIKRQHSNAEIVVLGTAEGLESRLVPARGFELLTIPKLPFPRRLNAQALSFGPSFDRTVKDVRNTLREREIDCVVGFGGYASAPAYLATRKTGVSLSVHEGNAKPGLANRLGARLTQRVGITFPGTKLPHAKLVGMPLRREIVDLDRAALRQEARKFLQLGERPTLLITGGSTGARHLNEVMASRLEAIIALGYQIIHLLGAKNEPSDFESEHYRPLNYADRMDLVLALTDFAITRAGANIVAELTALGIAALYVPLPVGNGEQRLNVSHVLAAGGGLLVPDRSLTPAWLDYNLLPMLTDPDEVATMGKQARSVGILDASERLLDLVLGQEPQGNKRR